MSFPLIEKILREDTDIQERLYNMFLTELEQGKYDRAKEIYKILEDKTKPDKELKRRLKLNLIRLVDECEMDTIFFHIQNVAPLNIHSIRFRELHSILNNN